MKLFRASNIEIAHYCQTVFGCELPSVLLVTRYDKFIKKLEIRSVERGICPIATSTMNELFSYNYGA